MNIAKVRHRLCFALREHEGKYVWVAVCGRTMNLPRVDLKLFTWKKNGLQHLVDEETGMQIMTAPTLPSLRFQMLLFVGNYGMNQLKIDLQNIASVVSSAGPKPIIEITNKYHV